MESNHFLDSPSIDFSGFALKFTICGFLDMFAEHAQKFNSTRFGHSNNRLVIIIASWFAMVLCAFLARNISIFCNTEAFLITSTTQKL